MHDIREWRAKDEDWRATRERIAGTYGYDKYGGNCHMVPNHALIILALLYGENDFQKALMIANTSGWDTDCNSGNVGCLLGIKNGLAGMETGPDWRGPIADRLYTAHRRWRARDHRRSGRDLQCREYRPGAGRRSATGAERRGALPLRAARRVQGFQPEQSVETRGTLHARKRDRPQRARRAQPGAALPGLAPGRIARAATPTFFGKDGLTMPTYQMVACPTLYPGQTVDCGLAADVLGGGTVSVRLYASVFAAGDTLVKIHGEPRLVGIQPDVTLKWQIPDTRDLDLRHRPGDRGSRSPRP